MTIVDPIFAAIERHRVAEAAYRAAQDLSEEAFNELGDESHRQYAALLQVTPTTAAGSASALLYISRYVARYGDGLFGNWSVETAGNAWLDRVAIVLQS